MTKDRREFLKKSGLSGMGIFSLDLLELYAQTKDLKGHQIMTNDQQLNMIGPYGPWANSLFNEKIPSLSFRNDSFSDLNSWKKLARERVKERIGLLNIGDVSKVTVLKETRFEGLTYEEISNQLSFDKPMHQTNTNVLFIPVPINLTWPRRKKPLIGLING
jgi:hypothetical protein